jgi:parvulin-like peptidyl-prolyl isomerase
MGTSKQGLSRRLNWRKLVMGVGLAGLVGGAFCFGRLFSPAEAVAKPPEVVIEKATEPMPPPLYKSTGDREYCQRAVAWIGDSEVVTREELGEYLIARFGAERLEMLVNKRIINKACQEKDFDVTEAEIDSVLVDDLKSLNMDKKQFVNNLLKKYNKSLYEWREDVIRPKLQMKKLAQDRVTVTADDLAKAYEAYYGEQVRCQMIMWPTSERDIAFKVWDSLRKDPNEFDKLARMQASAPLARVGGQLDPIARHTTGDESLEQLLFSLEKGEVSPVRETREGIVVVKCLERIPANKTKRLEDVRAELEKEVIEKKTVIEVTNVFNELRKKANPKLYLKKPDNDNDYRQAAEQELRNSLGKSGNATAKPPLGN